MKKVISTTAAPAAVGPYSQAVRAGDFIFVSGQIPLDPATGALHGDTTAEQALQCFRNIEAILKAEGLGLGDIVKATVLLTDIADFAAVNEVYAKQFSGDFPARAAYQVAALPKGAKVEIETIAYAKRS